MSWEDVREEMVENKKLDRKVADKIGEYVKMSGKLELVEKLEKDVPLAEVKDAAHGLSGLKGLLRYCEAMGIADSVSYYTVTNTCSPSGQGSLFVHVCTYVHMYCICI